MSQPGCLEVFPSIHPSIHTFAAGPLSTHTHAIPLSCPALPYPSCPPPGGRRQGAFRDSLEIDSERKSHRADQAPSRQNWTICPRLVVPISHGPQHVTFMTPSTSRYHRFSSPSLVAYQPLPCPRPPARHLVNPCVFFFCSPSIEPVPDKPRPNRRCRLRSRRAP